MQIKENLKKHFGFVNFKGEQEDIIKSVLQGKNTFVLMPTGGGKSLCYQLPALMLDGVGIVISPLIALMKNQVDSVRGISLESGIAHYLNSTLKKSELATVKKDILAGKTKLLYVAPETLTKETNVEFLKQIKISFYAVDEAHCISEWGHDFRPEYRRIRPIVEEIGIAPIIALTATATPKVQHDIQKILGIQDANVFKSSFNRDNLYYEIRAKKNPVEQIIKLFSQNKGKSGIIYCLSRKKVEEIAQTLQVNGIKALPYHAGMDAQTRTLNQDRFLKEDVDVIVATIAFGMGIDKPDVRYVIHFDMPKSLEGYYQETGRGGRDGLEGHCIAFYSYKDIQKLEGFMQNKPIAEQEIGRELLLETVSFVETSTCRRKTLLNYFGEKYERSNCGSCDNCLHPRDKKEAKEDVVKVFKVIKAVNEKFKGDHISDILVGNACSSVKTYKHHKLPVFGIAENKDKNYWLAVIRHMLIERFITKDIENYGLLKITKEGEEFIEKPRSFMVTENLDYSGVEEDQDSNDDGSKIGSSAGDPVLFKILKELNKKVAKVNDVPPFVVFQDSSLEDMSTNYPITMDELYNISGVGVGKAHKYGKDFIELIKRYVDENDIIRPTEMIIKTVANKSKLKISIIQNIDRKLSFEEIEKLLGVTRNDLLNEIESIVYAGTKINIDYYIDEIIDEEGQEDIYNYFLKETETDSLEEALQDLKEYYTEEEIRFIRIKFLSELGN